MGEESENFNSISYISYYLKEEFFAIRNFAGFNFANLRVKISKFLASKKLKKEIKTQLLRK